MSSGRVIDRYDVFCYQCGARIGTVIVRDDDDPVWLRRDIRLLCDSCMRAWKGD